MQSHTKVLRRVIGRKFLKQIKIKVPIEEEIGRIIKYITVEPMAGNVRRSKLRYEVASLNDLVCTDDGCIRTMVSGGSRQLEHTQLWVPSMERCEPMDIYERL